MGEYQQIEHYLLEKGEKIVIEERVDNNEDSDCSGIQSKKITQAEANSTISKATCEMSKRMQNEKRRHLQKRFRLEHIIHLLPHCLLLKTSTRYIKVVSLLNKLQDIAPLPRAKTAAASAGLAHPCSLHPCFRAEVGVLRRTCVAWHLIKVN